MKIFKTADYVNMKVEKPDELYRAPILTEEDGAESLNGIVVVIPPGFEGGAGHYHKQRNSLFIVISGEAFEVIEGEYVPIKVGDVFFVPPGKVHTIANRSDKDFRVLEFFTHPPVAADFHPVEK
jgi:quercetin dioxygenase-like cupin family protein